MSTQTFPHLPLYFISSLCGDFVVQSLLSLTQDLRKFNEHHSRTLGVCASNLSKPWRLERIISLLTTPDHYRRSEELVVVHVYFSSIFLHISDANPVYFAIANSLWHEVEADLDFHQHLTMILIYRKMPHDKRRKNHDENKMSGRDNEKNECRLGVKKSNLIGGAALTISTVLQIGSIIMTTTYPHHIAHHASLKIEGFNSSEQLLPSHRDHRTRISPIVHHFADRIQNRRAHCSRWW